MVSSEFERFLQDKHQYNIMKLMFENDEVKQNDFYGNPCRNHDIIRNSRMPDKLNVLEKAGLIHQVQDGRSTRLYITSKGLEVAKYLFEIEDILHKP